MSAGVGVIGLGAMGGPIARHLLRRGHQVIAFDIRPEPVEAASALGARRAGPPRDASAGPGEEIMVISSDRRPRIVDLTLPVQSGMPGIPGIPFYDRYPVTARAVTVINEEQRALLQSQDVDVMPDAEVRGVMNMVLTINSHVGTHIDAPRHFIHDGTAIDEVPLDRIVMREAIVLDVSQKGPGAAVTGDDLERTGITPAPHQVAVIKTLWTDRAWGTPEFWPEMVYLDPTVGDWILDKQVSAVAMDCFPEKAFWRMAVSSAERGINHK